MTPSAPWEPIASVEGTVEHLADHGDGVLTWEGRPLMVSGVLPGERVRVAVRKRYRRISVGELLEVLTPSSHRVPPPCPYFGPCGGCQLQHADLAVQHAAKRARIGRALAAAGLSEVEVLPVWSVGDGYRYRNHGRFTVEEGRIGFVQRRPQRHLPIERCLLMDPVVDEVLTALRGRLPAEATQVNVRVGVRTGQRMIQPKLGPAVGIETGQPHLHEVLAGHRFRISAPSFFQVHTAAAELLVEAVRHVAAGSETVVDAYAGVGTFAAALAPTARKVTAVECSGPAMEDARVNLAGLSNVELVCGAAEDVLSTLEGPNDTIVLDPPRRGCHPRALAAVRAARPRRVAYVACDPQSLARDLARLAPAYVVDWVQPVDLFPQTHHIEAVAALRLPDQAPCPPPSPPPRASRVPPRPAPP